METTFQCSWHVLIKQLLQHQTPYWAQLKYSTLTGEKNYPSKKKANTDLLINYLQGVLPHLQRWIKKGGGWVVPKLWKEVVGA